MAAALGAARRRQLCHRGHAKYGGAWHKSTCMLYNMTCMCMYFAEPTARIKYSASASQNRVPAARADAEPVRVVRRQLQHLVRPAMLRQRGVLLPARQPTYSKSARRPK
jgi:hypothetical protein